MSISQAEFEESEQYWKKDEDTFGTSFNGDDMTEGENSAAEKMIDTMAAIKQQKLLRNSMKQETLTKPFPNYGWICPVCGRGLSPFTSVCPCRNKLGVTF